MTSIEIESGFHCAAPTQRGRSAHQGRLRQLLQNWAQGRADRRQRRLLAQFEPHLLRDMGFDPEAIYGGAYGWLTGTHADRMRRL